MFSTGALLGIATYVCLLITFGLGIAMHKFFKPVLKYHKPFAFLTVILATINLILILT